MNFTTTNETELASGALTPGADATVEVFVDPQCPFAWITSRWLLECAQHTDLRVDVRLMSLACINEGRELDAWYREYNDDAWAAARVAAALLDSPRRDEWPRFYDTFGQRRHVDGVRDNVVNLTATVRELGLPDDLLAAAAEDGRDDDLRTRTREAVAGSGGDGGTPVVRIHGRSFFGPVLTSVPRGQDAVRLWRAVESMASTPGFSSISTERSDDLRAE